MNDYYKYLLEEFWKNADSLFPVLNKLYKNEDITYEEYGRILKFRKTHERRYDNKKSDKDYYFSLYHSGLWKGPMVLGF